MSKNPMSEAETARHYGNMAFAMFTVFTTITGALFSFVFSEGSKAFLSVSSQRLCLGLFGAMMELFFALSMMRVSYLVYTYQNIAIDAGDLYKPKGHGLWSVLAPLTLTFPFVAAILFWCLLAFNIVKIV